MTDNLEFALENISNQDRTIRRQAFEIIEQAREKAVPGLITILGQDNGYRQDIALSILWGFFRDHQITHPDLTPALIGAIRANKDNNPLVIHDGIGFIADLKDSTAFDDLIEFLHDDEEMLREGAIEALALLKDVRAIPFLIPLLKDVVQDIRFRVVWALGYIDDSKGVQVLVDILKNANHPYYELALAKEIVEILSRVGTPEALDAVKDWENKR